MRKHSALEEVARRFGDLVLDMGQLSPPRSLCPAAAPSSSSSSSSSSSFANNDGGGGDSDSDDDDLPLVPVLEWVLPRTVTVVLDNGRSGAGEVEGLLKGSSSELVAIADNFVFRNQGLKKRKQSSDVIVRAVSNPPPHLPYYFLFFCSYQWSPKESSRDMNLG